MNSRRIPEPESEKNRDARPVPTSDQRSLVLLLIGLLVIAVHLAGRYDLKSSADQGAGSLIWLTGSTLQAGAYWASPQLLPPMSADLTGLYHALDLTPPAAPVLEDGHIFASREHIMTHGLRLENGRLPAVIAPPAVWNSFLFLPIPINEADRELLTTVPGIGPQLAELILALRRERKQFTGPEDLLAVPGIGRVKLRRLAEHLSFRQSSS